MNKHDLVHHYLKHDYLLSPDLLDHHPDTIDPSFFTKINTASPPHETPIVIHHDLYTSLEHNGTVDINWLEFEKSRVLKEKQHNTKLYDAFLSHFATYAPVIPASVPQLATSPPTHATTTPPTPAATPSRAPPVTLLRNYEEESAKRGIKDFVKYYKIRYDFLSSILQHRPDLTNLTSINRLAHKEPRSEVSIIGLVYDKITTKSGDTLLTIEDPTGHVNVYINKTSTAHDATETICYDEVIGVKGVYTKSGITATTIIFPDIINTKNKTTTEDVYAAFISDIHVGSKYFLEKEFLSFIQWINGDLGDEKQRAIAKSLRYVLMAGDLVDGIGVYPGQEDNLHLKDITQQYARLAELLKLITRDDIALIICPGQHDATRISQPQPALHKGYAAPLWTLPNATLVSNPALVNIHASPAFEGFTILLYHGASFHYYIDHFETLRKHKPRDNPTFVHKFLLQKRHLSPSHTATVYTAETKDDPLLITTVPDVLVCGDMHKSGVSTYNGIITINCSCWQAKTDFQEKTGNNPDPGKVPLLNLKTRTVTIMDFSTPTPSTI